MIVAPTLAPGADGVLQDHELTVALVVDVDHLRPRGAYSAGAADHIGGIIGIVTKQNLEF